MTVHQFSVSHDKAQEWARAALWDDVYAAAFPGRYLRHELNGDADTQRREVDRHVHFGDGGAVRVEEKYDSHDTGNFFLEYWSVREQRKLGWIARDDLLCDWFVYAFVMLNVCYFLPWPQLRTAWREIGPTWDVLYPSKEIPNDGYTTVGLVVPIWQVLDALDGAGAFIVQRGSHAWMRRSA